MHGLLDRTLEMETSHLIVKHPCKILVGVTDSNSNLDIYLKILSMMDFWEVVHFQDLQVMLDPRTKARATSQFQLNRTSEPYQPHDLIRLYPFNGRMIKIHVMMKHLVRLIIQARTERKKNEKKRYFHPSS
ncbi:unnamed protein product [Musa acuminata subsp. burmannicoides]